MVTFSKSAGLVAVVIILNLWATQAWSLEKNLYGKAYDVNEKQLLYHEVHKIIINDSGFNTSVETKYLDTNLKEFANLKSVFKKNPFVPDSTLVDTRLNRKETLDLDGDNAIIEVKVKGQEPRKKVIEVKENSVAGQGFNNFIVKNFSDLVSGQEKKVSFIVIQILDYFNFEALKVKEKPNENLDSVSFKIAISSLFLKAFADPIIVKYDLKTKELLEFRGLSNLNTAKDEKQSVVIKYSDRPPISP